MSQKLSANMNVTVSLPPRVFQEIEVRATKQHISRSAIVRQVVCDWFDDLAANSADGDVVK